MTKRRQCAKCPWRVDVDPNDIPNGYCEEMHASLRETIQEGFRPGPLRAMACHESPIGKERHCVGWVANQLGPGNNLALRMMTLSDPSIADFELIGEQHNTFDDTLP